MSRKLRNGIIGLLALVGAVAAMAPAVAGAENKAALRLQRFHYTLDGGGTVYLALKFINDGNGPVSVKAVAPDPKGPWTMVNQSIASGDMLRTQFKSPADGVSVVWIDSSQGLMKFDIPKRR